MTALADTTVIAGDPRLQRFRALYRGEFGFVWSAAQHLGVPPGQVDEVVQDVFLTAFRRLDHLRFEASPRAWLFGVTRRVAFRYRRGAARRARRMQSFAELGREVSGAPQQRHDDAQQLGQLLAGLGEGNRAVWELTEILGMSAPEIASELRLPLNTVYSRLRLARQQLSQRVAQAEALEQLRDRVRREQAAPAEAERRSWAALLPVLGREGGALGVLAWAKAWAGVATLGIALGAVTVAAVVIGGARGPEVVRAVEPTLEQGGRPRGDEDVAPVVVRAVEVEAAAVEAAAPRRPGVGRPRAGVAEDAVGLSEEILLIDRLQAAVAADDRAGAQRAIAEHRRRFAAGSLGDLREAARIELLCRGGEGGAAEAAARELAAAQPESAVAQRFGDYRCR